MRRLLVALTHVEIVMLGFALAFGLTVCLALVIAIRGTKPNERPEIIRALADLFNALRKRRR